MTEPTAEDIVLYDDVTALGEELWTISKKIEGLNNDPKMFSILLFRRLRSNHQGYTLLWKNRLDLEADIVLRSAIESSICIAANSKLGSDFVSLMLEDTASTIKGQITVQNSHFGGNSVKFANDTLKSIAAHITTDTKPKKLNWAELAKHGGVDLLYGFHKMLSAGSSHVTGISILRGVTGAGLGADLRSLEAIERNVHLSIMAWTTLIGVKVHAGIIGERAIVDRANALEARMDVLSRSTQA